MARFSNLNDYFLSGVIVLLTFDSIVIPLIRFSFADLTFLTLFAFSLKSKAALNKSFFILLICTPLLIVFNSFLYYNNPYFDYSKINLTKSNLGFLRPIFYTLISIFIFYRFKNSRFDLFKLYKIMAYSGIILSVIVFLQYTAVFPFMYHNNPSFGETGRFTLFKLGYRPTGLSNEASFIGIYLVLILSLILYLKTRIKENLGFVLQRSDVILLFGVFFTTSRLALIVALFLFILKSSFFKKFLGTIIISILLLLNPTTYNRFLILFDGSGDNSTIERFGSNDAYVNAIFSDFNIFGTGYLNANSQVQFFLDPSVDIVLDGRQLPSFSLPLQLSVEFGLFFVITALIIVVIFYRKIIFTLPILSIFLCSFLTGIQNFLFVYFFIAITYYATGYKYYK